MENSDKIQERKIPNAIGDAMNKVLCAGRLKHINELMEIKEPTYKKEIEIEKLKLRLIGELSYLETKEHTNLVSFLLEMPKTIANLYALLSRLDSVVNREDKVFNDWATMLSTTVEDVVDIIDKCKCGKKVKSKASKASIIHSIRIALYDLKVSWVRYAKPVDLNDEIKGLVKTVIKAENKLGCSESAWRCHVKEIYSRIQLIDKWDNTPNVYKDIIEGDIMLTEKGRIQFMEGNIAFTKTLIKEWLKDE